MFGRERSLVKRFGGQPFVLLGVNGDPSLERLRQIQEKAELNWVSWWDGPQGPILASWGIDCFPTFVLIDPRGEIRWRHAGVPPDGVLESKIESLLAEGGTFPAS